MKSGLTPSIFLSWVNSPDSWNYSSKLWNFQNSRNSSYLWPIIYDAWFENQPRPFLSHQVLHLLQSDMFPMHVLVEKNKVAHRYFPMVTCLISLERFNFRWLKIKGIHTAFPMSITLISHHLKWNSPKIFSLLTPIFIQLCITSFKRVDAVHDGR